MVYGKQQHIFYRGSNGLVYHIFWDHGAGFFWEQWSGPGGKTWARNGCRQYDYNGVWSAAAYLLSWKQWISLSYILGPWRRLFLGAMVWSWWKKFTPTAAGDIDYNGVWSAASISSIVEAMD